MRPVPLAVAVKVFCSEPFDSVVRLACSALSAADSAPYAEIWVLSLLCCALSAAAWPAVFALTSAVTSELTSIDELPVEPLMIDWAACCSWLLAELLAAVTAELIVDIVVLRAADDPWNSG